MRKLVLGLAILLGVAQGCSPERERSAEPPPRARASASAARVAVSEAGAGADRVILISIDTLRADHLGTYGHSRFTSPVIDAFAAEGTVFEDASSPAPWTLPAHASMLTGLYPLRSGVTTPRTALPDEVPTLAAMLERHGFTTAAVVNSTWLKQGNFGLTREFDEFLAVDDADYARRTPNTWVTDQAIQWVKDRVDERLFVFVHYYDVHADYASLPPYEQLFVTPYDGPADGTGWQLQVENFDPRHIAYCVAESDPAVCRFGSSEKPRVIDETTRRIHFDAADVRHLEELYDAGIRQLDSELGRLFGFLDEHGLAERTLVIVTADHGEEFMEHGRVEHHLTTYQEMLHVPLVLRGPGVSARLRVDAPVSLVDIVPTTLSLVGVPVPEGLDGRDLSPLLRGGDARAFAERPLFGEAAGAEGFPPPLDDIYPVYRSVRRGRYKLISKSLLGGSALYDLEADPGEQVDIREKAPELAERLEDLLVARHAAAAADGEDAEDEDAVELDPEELERLRALGYVP